MLWQFYCGVFLKSSMWRPYVNVTLCLRVLEVILIAVVITFAVAAATYVNQKPPPKPKKLTEREGAASMDGLCRRWC